MLFLRIDQHLKSSDTGYMTLFPVKMLPERTQPSVDAECGLESFVNVESSAECNMCDKFDMPVGLCICSVCHGM